MGAEKGSAAALLPIGIFLVIFLGSGIVTGDFYAMPAIVAFLIALHFYSTEKSGSRRKSGSYPEAWVMKISLRCV